MSDDNMLINELLAALQRQRDEALNKLAKSEANHAVLVADMAKLRETAGEETEEP